jgi:2'-5' RNA ligase
MPYAVTLPLDAEAAAQIRQMWCALAEQAGTDDAILHSYVPHITLAALPDDTPVPEIEKAVSLAVEGWTTFSVVLAGFGVFPGTSPVVWAAPVVTAGLLARHASVCAALGSFGIHLHYRPEHWVPHVTLSQEGSSSVRVIEIVTSMWNGPIATRLERVELVRFLPVTVLRSQILKPEDLPPA